MDRYVVDVNKDGWSIFDKETDKFVMQGVGKTQIEEFLDFQQNQLSYKNKKNWFERLIAALAV